MTAATHSLGSEAPVGAVSPPAPNPPARAPIPLRDFLASAGLELLESSCEMEVYGFAPAGPDGKPDMSRATML